MTTICLRNARMATISMQTDSQFVEHQTSFLANRYGKMRHSVDGTNGSVPNHVRMFETERDALYYSIQPISFLGYLWYYHTRMWPRKGGLREHLVAFLMREKFIAACWRSRDSEIDSCGRLNWLDMLSASERMAHNRLFLRAVLWRRRMNLDHS